MKEQLKLAPTNGVSAAGLCDSLQRLSGVKKVSPVAINCGSQSMVRGPAAAAAAPENLLEMQNLRPHSRPTEWENLGMGLSHLVEEALQVILMNAKVEIDCQTIATQSVVCNHAASAPFGSLLEMQNLFPLPHSHIRSLMRSPGGSYAY